MLKYLFHLSFLLSFLNSAGTIYAQDDNNFSIKIEPLSIPQLGGLQSYSVGQWDEKWLLVGGRLDGLHIRFPFASFDESGNNNSLIVVDPVLKKTYSKPLSSLPKRIAEQLSSTNALFTQVNDELYIIGGYGYNETDDDHITYPHLTIIDIPKTIKSIIDENDFTDNFQQYFDSNFAVTGGKLLFIDEIFYIVGGQNFIGRYNPMGADRGPGFIQIYNENIIQFTIDHNREIEFLKKQNDEELLHRRDVNVVHQIAADGHSKYASIFSGVFQHVLDLPFMDLIHFNQDTFWLEEDFRQFYNHYHCANIPLYDSIKKEMHTLFFGGIAQYYQDGIWLTQDDNVPFVKSISRITRDSKGQYKEYLLSEEMPGYLGAASEFILNPNIPVFENGVIKLAEIQNQETLLGYIYGGIHSSKNHVFWENEDSLSFATPVIFKVWLKKEKNTKEDLNEQSFSKLRMNVFCDIFDKVMYIDYTLDKEQKVNIKITDNQNNVIHSTSLIQEKGKYTYNVIIENLDQPAVYFVEMQTELENVKQQIIVDP